MPTSPDNTITTSSGASVTDAAGNEWKVVDGTVFVNGTADPTTANVLLLAYENGNVWQMNADRLWWSKSTPSDSWAPTYGTSVSPLTDVASIDNTVLVGSIQSSISTHDIIDANDDHWSITASAQVAVNGVADPTTDRVTAIAYEQGVIWQENADHLWWSKPNAASPWSPNNGTTSSPVPPTLPEPQVQYLDGSVVDYMNSVTPSLYSVLAVADGDKGIIFSYSGDNTNAGSIRNAMGNLTLDIAGTMVSSGSLTTQGGIGNAYTTIELAAGSSFTNTGLISTAYASAGDIGGHLVVSGSGAFHNDGTINIDGGSSNDFSMSGDIFNSGRLTITDAFGTQHAVITSGNITNTGTVENHNQTTIQWGYAGPPQSLPHSAFTNDGVIANLDDVGHLTLAAGAFVHAADSYQVHDYHGTLVNNGQILANGGGDEIDIAAPLRQGEAGHIDIQNFATVRLDSTSDGGTINLTSGMLAFGGDRIQFHGPAGATGFHSNVALNGSSAAFDFGRSDISEVFKATSPASGELMINLTATGAPEQIADIHLVGAYYASQFQLSGNQVIYTKTT